MIRLRFAVTATLVSACAHLPSSGATVSEQDWFWAGMTTLCGRSFAGSVEEAAPPEAAGGERLTVRAEWCTPGEMRIVLDSGNDDRTTMLLTRRVGGLRLTHLRRLPDGREDSLSRFGGLARPGGNRRMQTFVLDSTLADRLPAGAHTQWSFRLTAGDTLVYAASDSASGRRFRAGFDLARPVAFPLAAGNPCGTSARRDPLPGELRCRWGIGGPGRFGLLSYADVPVYQSETPLPGTHLVRVPGMPSPARGESFEAWEWRVLQTPYGAQEQRVHRGLELLDPRIAERIVGFERSLAAAGIPVRRRETWRLPARQAYIFQQGRSRPGPLATATLTSWHSHVDSLGRPAALAVDYDVGSFRLARFHELATAWGLASFGADSNDPGHVFLPSPDALTAEELVLLRVMPRVPVVTLATGRPVDEAADRISASLHRAAMRRWLEQPFAPSPRLVIQRSGDPPLLLVPPAARARVSDASRER